MNNSQNEINSIKEPSVNYLFIPDRRLRTNIVVRLLLLLSGSKTLSEGCDWPVGNTTSKLTTNRRTAKKRKFISKVESECGVATKKRRRI